MSETHEGAETAPDEEPQTVAEAEERQPVAEERQPVADEAADEAKATLDEAAEIAEAANKDAEEARARVAKLELELSRERAARKYGLPDELVALLRPGSVDADAQALASHLNRGTALGSGGLDPTDTHDPKSEGMKLAERIFARSRRF